MKIGIIIQARMGSSRLPNKVLVNLAGVPVLKHVVERCKKSKADIVIVATSVNKENNAIEDFCKKNDYNIFRGSEDDVLSRFYEASLKFKLDAVIRVTGDCPLIDPETIDKIIDRFKSEDVDYLSNVAVRSYPRGLDCEIMNFEALKKSYILAKEKPDREHVTAFIYRNPEMFKLGKIIATGILNNPNIRLCVDTKEDLELMNILFSKLYKNDIDIIEVIKFLNENPELVKINKASEKEQIEKNKQENVRQIF